MVDDIVMQCTEQFPDINWSTLTLYTTGEPCIMCSSACCWAGVKRMVCGTDIAFMKTLWGIEANMRAIDVFQATPKAPQLTEKYAIIPVMNYLWRIKMFSARYIGAV